MDLNYSKRDLMQTCWKILMMRIIKHWAALSGRLGNLQCYGLVGAGELYRLILHSWLRGGARGVLPRSPSAIIS